MDKQKLEEKSGLGKDQGLQVGIGEPDKNLGKAKLESIGLQSKTQATSTSKSTSKQSETNQRDSRHVQTSQNSNGSKPYGP